MVKWLQSRRSDEALDLARLEPWSTIGQEDPTPETYQAWATRLTQKRTTALASIRDAKLQEPPSLPNHWSADGLFLQADEDTDVLVDHRDVGAHLRMLGLCDGADGDDVHRAYRALAKQHHPDRWAQADATTKAFHAKRMQEINRARAALTVWFTRQPAGRR